MLKKIRSLRRNRKLKTDQEQFILMDKKKRSKLIQKKENKIMILLSKKKIKYLKTLNKRRKIRSKSKFQIKKPKMDQIMKLNPYPRNKKEIKKILISWTRNTGISREWSNI